MSEYNTPHPPNPGRANVISDWEKTLKKRQAELVERHEKQQGTRQVREGWIIYFYRLMIDEVIWSR